MPKIQYKKDSVGKTKLTFLKELLYPKVKDKNEFPKVLVATMFYDMKEYCITEFIANVKEFNYPNFDFVMWDNSREPTHWEMANDLYEVKVIKTPFVPTTRKRQELALNQIREYFLEGDYDYLFLLESDLFPNRDIVARLMEHNVPVVSAVYLIGNVDDITTKIPCVTTGRFEMVDSKWKESFMAWFEVDGEVKETHGGCGLGAILIKREVIEKVKFRSEKLHSDTYFHRDIHKKGYATWVDTTMILAHYQSAYPRGDF